MEILPPFDVNNVASVPDKSAAPARIPLKLITPKRSGLSPVVVLPF